MSKGGTPRIRAVVVAAAGVAFPLAIALASSGRAEFDGTRGRIAARSSVPAPKPVPAWYMTARTVGDLEAQAAADACAFARAQPAKSRVLLLDFGKADKYAGRFGAQLRTGPHFSNADILGALKAAADRYPSFGCYVQGSARITYGNTNNMPETMDESDVRKAGFRQALTAHRLRDYEQRLGYDNEGAAVAGDIEPQWNLPGITKALVDTAANGSGGLYFDYGAASECPPEGPSCSNHWDLGDLGQVSFGGVKKPLPEIYRPVHAKQWRRVRQRWDSRHGGTYCFYGVTATPGFPLSPAEGWRRLAGRNPCVNRELVEIRDNAPAKAALAGAGAETASVGAPMRRTYAAQMVGHRLAQAGLTEPGELWPVRNGWIVSSRRRLTAVYAGADPSRPSTGRLVVFRQDFIHVTQTSQVVDVSGSGPLEITAAPLAAQGKRSMQRRGALAFAGHRTHGTLHLNNDSVTVG
jgi:hypothetical protein